MVNLNAPRNLPPDNTPWGKAIERRLNDLEKANNLLANEVKNNAKGAASLTNTVFSGSEQVTYQTEYQNFSFPSGTWDNTFVLDPLVSGTTRTGSILVSGSIPVYMYNIDPVGSADYTEIMSWSIEVDGKTASGTYQGGQIPAIPRNVLVYHEIGVSLPFYFVVRNLSTNYNFRLTLRLMAPQDLSRCDIRIPGGWSIVTQRL